MSNNLTKRQIVQTIYENNNYKQEDVRQIVQQTLDIVRDALVAGRNIELRKFGVFEIQVRKARVGRNPNRPETDVVIPRRAVVKVKAGKELKEGLVNLDLDSIDPSWLFLSVTHSNGHVWKPARLSGILSGGLFAP